MGGLSNYQTWSRLGWCLLERKFVYYDAPELGLCPDSEYDYQETRYREMSSELGYGPYVSETVGFPRDTPAGKLVAQLVRERGFTTWP